MLYPKGAFESGDFAIMQCSPVDIKQGEPYDSDTIVVKGKVYSANFGSLYHLTGELVQDDYGKSYKIISFEENFDFSEEEDKLQYLSMALTEKQFDLVRTLPDPFGTLERGDVDALMTIKGVGKDRAKKMIRSFNARKEEAKAFAKLSRYGLSVTMITNLMSQVTSADMLVAMIEENPYLMIDNLNGIGWAKADKIAKEKGIQGADPRRVNAYVKYILSTQAEDGHTWMAPQSLWDALSFDLKIDDQLVLKRALQSLHDKKEIWWDEDKKDKIALTYLHNLEENISKELHRIASGQPLKPAGDAEEKIREMEEEQGWQFTEEQREAMEKTLYSNVVIITGQSGTGKSSSVAGVLKLLSGYSFNQCALSGRAAARLQEVTGEQGSTIHRLLGYQPGQGFVYNKENPLPYDIIILDEVSMVGASIFYSLIKAIPTGAKLIMLGDVGQLEAIGLCNLFNDMLESGMIPVGRLTKIQRQAAKSAIITEAHKVSAQQQLTSYGWTGQQVRGEMQDFLLDVYSDSILTRPNILDHYKSLIESGVSKDDIQVVVPMKVRGDACVLNVNNDIQAYINPHGRAVKFSSDKSDYQLRQGDRVICNKNYYQAKSPEGKQTPVYNGDRGVIKNVLPGNNLCVHFDMWGDIIIPQGKLSYIELGYALSCHKLQGSEAPYIIVGFDYGSRVLLTKEWLYTAITRAKKKCILTCEKGALWFAIKTSNVPHKRTFLKEMLEEEFSHPYKGEDEEEEPALDFPDF